MLSNVSNLIYSVNIINSSTGTAKILYNSVAYLFSSVRLASSDKFESELDRANMDRLLKWMGLFFENYELIDKNESETKKEYRKELYNVYATISSDYRQYIAWKKYNQGIWILPYYRSKNTEDLAKKILMDVKLFDEGLSLFSKL